MRSRASIGLLIFVALLALPVSASATSSLSVAAKASPSSIGANGGMVSLRLTVRGAATCTFSSVPAISGFAGKVRCTNGIFTRSARLGKNIGLSRLINLKVKVSDSTRSLTAGATLRQSGIVVIDWSGNFGSAQKPFTTTTGETLTWTWQNGNGNYSSGMSIYNLWSSTALVSYFVNSTNTISTVPGGSGSVYLPPGQYDLDVGCVGLWTIHIGATPAG